MCVKGFSLRGGGRNSRGYIYEKFITFSKELIASFEGIK